MPMALADACDLARQILEGFRDSSLYEDYKTYDNWTDNDFESMLTTLREAAVGMSEYRQEDRVDRDTFVVIHNETGLFWHENSVWGPVDGCQAFDSVDRVRNDLPPGGEWLPLYAAVFTPESPYHVTP